jgi:hypothetical protein
LWTLLEIRDAVAEEAEDRRLLYVALTRAADAVAVSAAGGSGRYLNLLAPGLERAGAAVEARPFDPDDARWPSPPPPRERGDLGPEQARSGTPVSDRSRTDGARDPRIARAEADDLADAEGREAAAWDLAQAWVEAIAPEVGELVAGLRAEGIPAPRTGSGARSGGSRVLLTWPVDGGPVRLLEPGTGSGADGAPGYGLAVDPDDPEVARRRLSRALRGEAG